MLDNTAVQNLESIRERLSPFDCFVSACACYQNDERTIIIAHALVGFICIGLQVSDLRSFLLLSLGVALSRLLCLVYMCVPQTCGFHGVLWRVHCRKKVDHAIQRENLFAVAEILNRHKLFFWLGEGTALGAIRENNIINRDTDVDLGMYVEDKESFFRRALPELQACGFLVPKYRNGSRGDCLFSTYRDGQYVDIDFYGSAPQRCWAIIKKGPCEPVMDVLRPFGQAAIAGHIFTVPSVRYLVLLYGADWRVPKHGFKPKHVTRPRDVTMQQVMNQNYVISLGWGCSSSTS